MAKRSTLQIFLLAHCAGCAEAKRLAHLLSKDFPQLNILMVDLDDPAAEIPESVFAAPTYVFNGRVLYIGNPCIEEIRLEIASHMVDLC